MATVVVVMNKAAVDQFRGWSGPVGRSVIKLAAGMAIAQRFLSPKRTGALMASIRVGAHQQWTQGIMVKVGANPPAGGGSARGYSYHQDQGTMPHKIRARRAPQLVFFWVRRGVMFHGQSVNHPGNRAKNYIMDGARAAMKSWDGLYRG